MSMIRGPPLPDIHFIELLRKLRLEDNGTSLSYLRSAKKHVGKAGDFESESADSKHRRRGFHGYWEYRLMNRQSPGEILKVHRVGARS